jgi:hypothetical protein
MKNSSAIFQVWNVGSLTGKINSLRVIAVSKSKELQK